MNKNDKLTIKKLTDGIICGSINVLIFNGFDRALYKSITTSTSIFLKKHWLNPFQGISNAVIQRILTYGMYYPVYEMFETKTKKYIDEKKYYTVFSSVLTCCFTGLLTSPISAIKLTKWNSNHNKKNINMVKHMYVNGGISSFFRATHVTLKREIVFGGIFGYLSMNLNDGRDFCLDTLYAFVATSISSPFNYARVMIYKSSLNDVPTVRSIFENLIKNINTECHNYNIFTKIKYVLIKKFNIGWGTTRVSLGISLSRQLYLFFEQIDYL